MAATSASVPRSYILLFSQPRSLLAARYLTVYEATILSTPPMVSPESPWLLAFPLNQNYAVVSRYSRPAAGGRAGGEILETSKYFHPVTDYPEKGPCFTKKKKPEKTNIPALAGHLSPVRGCLLPTQKGDKNRVKSKAIPVDNCLSALLLQLVQREEATSTWSF